MAFNKQELEIIKAGKQLGKTREEIERALIKYRAGFRPEEQEADTGDAGFIQSAVSDIRGGLDAASQAAQSARDDVSDITDRVVSGETSPLSGTLQTIGRGLRGGAEAIGQSVLGFGKAFLPKEAEENIGEAVSGAVKRVAETEPVQSAISRFQELEPDQQRNIKATLGVAEGLTTAFGFGPIISKVGSVINKTAAKALRASDDVLLKAKSAVPAPTGVPLDGVQRLIKDARFNLSDIDPNVENALKMSNFDEVNRYFQIARAAKEDIGKSTPMEIAGTKAVDAFDVISEARKKAIRGKNAILDDVGDARISGNTVNDVFSNAVKTLGDRFGVRVDAKGNITKLPGRQVVLDATDKRLIKDFMSRMNSLGVAPTLREVDDFVDWAQSQLYKQSKTISKLDAASDPVVRQLQGITGDLNTRLKESVGNGYGEVNARIAKLIELQDELSRMLGADARKGGGVMKQLFSPAGGNARRIFNEVQEETGIDLFKEATLARFAMETIGDVRQKSLLQELGASIDAAAELDLTKPASVVKWLRENADLDGQELANEIIRRNLAPRE